MITPIKAINKYVPILDKSILVVKPIKAKMANTMAVTKNTNTKDVNSKAIKYTENVRPVTNEYNKKHSLAIVGLILLILADKNITRPISSINVMIRPVLENKLIIMFGFIATK